MSLRMEMVFNRKYMYMYMLVVKVGKERKIELDYINSSYILVLVMD